MANKDEKGKVRTKRRSLSSPSKRSASKSRKKRRASSTPSAYSWLATAAKSTQILLLAKTGRSIDPYGGAISSNGRPFDSTAKSHDSKKSRGMCVAGTIGR